MGESDSAAVTSGIQGGGVIMVVNTSINGNTTRMALERMPYDVQSHEVDVLVIGFGMNDCNYWVTDKGMPRVSPNAFKANLEEIIERAFRFGAKQVVLRTNHPSPKTDYMTHTTITYGESNHFYNEIIREVAKSNPRVIFVDMEQEFNRYIAEHSVPLEELTLSDGVHLSLLGHKVYFDCMYPVISKIAEEY
ncbi:hypothetical protein IMSAGC011_01262 [Lachnospiraceae bacterium]|nr:hypothetical protein IMSAGC011_01262 [Lachnospiraceae bacterium]